MDPLTGPVKSPVPPVDAREVEGSSAERAQSALAAAYAEYRSAMAAWRAAARAEDAAGTEAVTERVLHARVRLYRALVATGWGPPPAVGAQLERDAALVEAPDGVESLLDR